MKNRICGDDKGSISLLMSLTIPFLITISIIVITASYHLMTTISATQSVSDMLAIKTLSYSPLVGGDGHIDIQEISKIGDKHNVTVLDVDDKSWPISVGIKVQSKPLPILKKISQGYVATSYSEVFYDG